MGLADALKFSIKGDLNMIVANIGHQKYKLKDIKDAEVLLKILNDSLPVEEHYIRNSRNVFSISKSAYEISLSIVQDELISDEALEILKEQYKHKDSI